MLLEKSPFNKPICLFLGAGASFPSGLPTFHDIRAHWVVRINDSLFGLLTGKYDDMYKKRLLKEVFNIPTEFLFQTVDKFYPSRLQEAFLKVFNSTKPNLNHRIAAQIFSNGGVIWTTNFDTLVEQACGVLPTDASKVAFNPRDAESFLNMKIRLLKPHGTLSDPSSWVFRSKDVLRRAPEQIAERLKHDVKSCFSIFLGYSASDIDIRPILFEALREGGEGIWFCMKGEKRHLTHLLSDAVEENRLVVIEHSNPSIEFQEWARQKGITEDNHENHIGKMNDLNDLLSLLEEGCVVAELLSHIHAYDLACDILKPYITIKIYVKNISPFKQYFSIRNQQGKRLGKLVVFINAIINTVMKGRAHKIL